MPSRVVINPLFKLLLWINVILCLSTLGVMLWLSSAEMNAGEGAKMSAGQERLFSTCDSIFKMTAGAFIGLLGGRAAAPDERPRL